jgi:uncharacterized protein YneR
MSISHTSGTLRQAAVIFTVFATIVALSGVVYLAPVAKEAYGQTIADGDLVKTADNPDVYIVKLVGAKSFKRLILNPTIFESYGHLSWGNIKTVSQATLNSYTNTNLVIEVNPDGSVADPKVYAVTSAAASDVGERRHLNVTAAEFESAGLDWDSIYKINHTEALPSFYPTMTALAASDNLAMWATQGPTGSSTSPASGLSVSLASNTPAARAVASGAADVEFARYNLNAGTSGSVTINEISVIRGGVSTTTNYTNVKLYQNTISPATKVGATLTLSTTTQKARFTGLNWTINAGQSDVLIVTATIHASNAIGNSMTLGINAASDIVLAGGETVSGSFPTFGNTVTPTTAAVGSMVVDVLATPAASSPISGSTEQHIASVKFTASTENFRVNSFRITQTGSATPSDLSNFKVKYLNDTLGTLASLSSNNTGTLTLSGGTDGLGNQAKTTTAKTFDIYADVTGGINVARTIIVTIQSANDVVVTGESSGGSVAVTAAGAFAEAGATHTISQGSFTAAISSAYNPTADNVVIGVEKKKGVAIRVSAGANEGVRITELKASVALADTAAVGTVWLAEVAADGSVGAILGQGTLSGSGAGTWTVTFGSNEINTFDTDPLFDVEKGKNKDVYILFDVPAGITVAGGDDTVIVSIAANADIKGDGLSSLNDLPACTSCTVTGNTFTEVATGSFAYSTSGTPAATTIVQGTTDVDFVHWLFTASGEDILVTSLVILAEEADGDAIDGTGDVTNIRLYKESISPANLLKTQASVTSGVVSLSFSDTVAASTSRTYILVADVPTTVSGESQIRFTIDDATDVTATGVSSGASITGPSSDLDGNFMTIGTGHLGVIASSLPVYTNVTEKSNGVEVARFVLASGTDGETVRVTSFKVTLKGTAGDSLSVDPGDLTSITLYDVNGGDIAGAGVKTKVVGSLTSAAANFTGLTVDIPTGDQRVLGVKVNIGDSSRTTPYIVMGVENYTTDVAATGLSSTSTIYANQLRTATGTNATLFAAFVLADLDMTAAVTDVDDELSDYGVPALGITASATALDNAVITVDSEHMLINDASASTLRADVTTTTDRAGWGGTTAAAHSTTGVPIVLHVPATSSISSAANNFSTNSNTSIVSATTVAGAWRVGQLLVQHDINVDNSEDDIKLITAIASNGLTTTQIDAYAGTAFTEDTGNDQFVTAMASYGQAQAVQAVGTLTLAVASGTPKAAQVVAGATNVEFSRVKLTSAFEPIRVTKMAFTRTGDTGVDNHLGGGSDADFASVYLQNLTDPTWGPNGNGKSNTVSVVSGVATFNLSDANALVVDHNVSTGIEVAIKGNLNTTTTGVTSGDAPKFTIAALNTTNLTAKGGSTGTTLSAFTAGTPTPATATNVNAQTILKGKLDIALNSTSLSGTSTRQANQVILKLDFDSADTGSVATFREASFNNAGALAGSFTNLDDGDWEEGTDAGTADSTVTQAGATINVLGGNSVRWTKGTADGADAFKFGFDAAVDLSDYSGVALWVQPGGTAAGEGFAVTLAGAGAGSHTLDVGALVQDDWTLVDVPFSDATTPFTGLTAITDLLFTESTELDATNTVDIGGAYFYKDKIKVDMASNAGLYDPSADDHTGLVTLKDGATTLATGYYSGTTSAGSVTFFPTSSDAGQFTIPTSGKTLSLISDTTTLITAVSKTLSMTVTLGSSDNGGAVTDGGVFWYDDSFNLSDNALRWVDSAVSPIQSGTISY